MVALAVAVFDHTHSALAVSGVFVASQFVPALAVPALVARVEASARRRELSGLYAFEALATVAIAVLLSHFWLPAILLLVALDSTAALTASALLRSETARAARAYAAAPRPAETVARERISATPTPPEGGIDAERGAEQSAEQQANAAINVAFSATFVIGPVLGGLLAAAAGAASALYLDAATFLACGAMLLDLHPHVEEAAGESVGARLAVVWRYINAVPALRSLLIAEAVALVFFEAAAPIQVSYANVTLGAGDSGFGVLLSVWGVGVVLGSLIFARSRPASLGLMVTGGTLAVGLAYLGFAVAPSLLLACAAALLGGVGNGTQWAPLVSAVQRLTPPSLHGRVMGALESIGALSPGVGLSLGGLLVTVTSARTAFAIVGAGATLMTLAFVRIPLGGQPPARDAEETVGERSEGASLPPPVSEMEHLAG